MSIYTIKPEQDGLTEVYRDRKLVLVSTSEAFVMRWLKARVAPHDDVVREAPDGYRERVRLRRGWRPAR